MTTTKIRQFQGTSKEGDFQSALQEAISKALTALSFIDGAVISDRRIPGKSLKHQVAKVDC
ncbi:MAG: hypothetical protein HC820_02855 [Hydrococcus sp. RM1_1_31]|nr:hypothetical protein [Hydrococcus sp. RM1_1_31]